MANLERIAERVAPEESAQENSGRNTLKAFWNKISRFKPYCVDVLSGWCYYTPVYAAQEALATLAAQGTITKEDIERIAFTRAIGLGAHAISVRPIGKVRNYVAKKRNITKESPFLDRLMVNLIGVTPIQSVTYGGMLVGGMAATDNYDWKSAGLAWLIGTGIGALHAFPFGYVQDKFRTAFGLQPAIKKK